jgi:hypothetical protein
MRVVYSQSGIFLFAFAAVIMPGFFTGLWMGRRFGALGAIAGLCLGLAGGIGFLYGIYLLARAGSKREEDKLRRGPPFRVLPPCKTGRCLGKDYQFLEWTPDGLVFICRCRGRYVKTHRESTYGLRFMELLSDGSLRPYFKLVGADEWYPEDPAPTL